MTHESPQAAADKAAVLQALEKRGANAPLCPPLWRVCAAAVGNPLAGSDALLLLSDALREFAVETWQPNRRWLAAETETLADLVAEIAARRA